MSQSRATRATVSIAPGSGKTCVAPFADDDQLVRTPQLARRPLVQRDHHLVVLTDDEQRWRPHGLDAAAGKVGPSAP